MKRVTLTFSFDVTDADAFVRQADERCRAEWNSSLRDIAGHDVDEDGLLVEAVFETFVASNGETWPEGTSDDANVEHFGSVLEVA
jgi:hypothetical protein